MTPPGFRLEPEYPGTALFPEPDREGHLALVSPEGDRVGSVTVRLLREATVFVGYIAIPDGIRGRGYGRRAVGLAFGLFPDAVRLQGRSLVAAEEFWASLGCRWLDAGDGTYRGFELRRTDFRP